MATEVSLCIIFTSSSSPVWADSYQIALFKPNPAVLLNAAADTERQMGRQGKKKKINKGKEEKSKGEEEEINPPRCSYRFRHMLVKHPRHV